MNDSGEFQEVESNYSGRLSHVSSQPVMIPSSRSMPSRDKRQHFDAWNQSGLQENVLVINFLRFVSPRDHHQGIQSDDVQRNGLADPEAGRTKTIDPSEDRLNQGTIPIPTSATKPLTTSCKIPVEFPHNSIVGQQRHQISELQVDNFPTPQSFLVRKIRFQNQATTCSTDKKERILADCQAEIRKHEFLADYDRRSIQKLDEMIESQKGEILSCSSRRRTTSTRSTTSS